MMNYLNSKTELFGRIGNEPEFHPSSEEVSSRMRLTVATTDDVFKGESDEWQEALTWHPVIGWGNLAERMNEAREEGRLVKGAKVHLMGQYKNNNYTDSSGTDHYEMQFHVQHFSVESIPSEN